MALAPAGSNWTDAENDLLVADYFAMLGEELAGRPYVKSQHNAGIATATGRGKGSIEFKYRNVSAVLANLGLPIVKGYLPAFNAQFGALTEAIKRYLSRTPAALEPELPTRSPVAGADPFVMRPAFDPSVRSHLGMRI